MDWILLSAIILDLVVVFVHVIAIRMLIIAKINNVRGSQRLLLLVLCVTELTFSILDINNKGLRLLEYTQYRHIWWMFSISSAVIMYIFVMTLITLDRFMDIYLNIKYDLHWYAKKTKILLTVAFVLSLLSGIPAVIVGLEDPCKVFKFLSLYVYPILEGVFVIIASLTYFYIIKQVQKHRKISKKIKKQLRENHIIPFQKPSRNRFRIYVPTLIIITFILFTIGPNVIKFFYFLNIIQSHYISHIAYLLIPVGFIADPLIYILNLKPVKTKLKQLIPGRNTINTTTSVFTLKIIEL